MFAAERHKEIKKILLEYKKINVSSLAKLLNVTEVTIRKDLEQLEQEGFLFRQHGGAILREDTTPNSAEQTLSLPFAPLNAKSKQDIALLCLQYIQNEDIIFLGGDDISCFIADGLQKSTDFLHLIVVTNCLYVSVRLAQSPFITLISPGGQLYNLNGIHAYYGSATIASLKQLYFTKAFLNIDAVSYDQGYMVSLQEISQLYEHIVPRSDEVVLTVESSKVNKRSLHHLIALDKAQTVVSNPDVPDQFKQYCFDHDIKLFTTLNNVMNHPTA